MYFYSVNHEVEIKIDDTVLEQLGHDAWSFCLERGFEPLDYQARCRSKVYVRLFFDPFEIRCFMDLERLKGQLNSEGKHEYIKKSLPKESLNIAIWKCFLFIQTRNPKGGRLRNNCIPLSRKSDLNILCEGTLAEMLDSLKILRIKKTQKIGSHSQSSR